ncbi:hypothetical protein AB0D08_25965 [Kitasatospora sp. NPDC048540]|uniref:hypothetical protein n=1 Tax=unclassified Kitasatospora TaxID=2633591 RepID=UPI00068F0653|nr:hypothetical protein [Kitasatospora sp. MBT63]
MDTYHGTGTLEWWANRSTCLGGYEVDLDIRVDEGGWTCAAALPAALTEDEREGFAFLMALDPVFTLRLEDGSSILVDVEADGDARRLGLSVCAG